MITADASWTAIGLTLVGLFVFIVALAGCSSWLATKQAAGIERDNPGVTCEVVFSGRGWSPECFPTQGASNR